jgi:hypothetical protein
MNNDEASDLYERAWIKWHDLQYLMLFEEMAELQKEIVKHLRGKTDYMSIAEEIADVQIMLDQMKLKFNPSMVEDCRQMKLKRLKDMLDAH